MVYRAKDLREAAYLLYRGAKPCGTVVEGTWVKVAFDDSDGRVSTLSTEYLGNPQVKLAEYFAQYDTIARVVKSVRELTDTGDD